MYNKNMKKLTIATGVIENNGKYLIARRTEPEWLKGLWEFPGGTVEENETVNETLIREILEETNLNIEPIKHLHTIVEIVKDREITINFILSKIVGDINIKLDEHDKYVWVDASNYNDYEWTGLTGQYAKILFK